MYMRNVMKAVVVCCCALVMAAACSAQGRFGGMQGVPTLGGIFTPVVGLGAAYDLTTPKDGAMAMQFAIVGTETVDGKQGYWFEVKMSGGKMPQPMLMKSLSVVDGNSMIKTKMIMMMNGTAYEMPDRMLQMNNTKSSTNMTSDAQDIGPESITVPAGTFATEHYKSKDGDDFWLAKEAGPWGMVKMVSKNGTTMVLTKVIHDAKDEITGTPQPFNPMAMGQHQ